MEGKSSLGRLYDMEQLANKTSFIHQLNPGVKLILTILYLFLLMSFNKYSLSGLVSFIIYPAMVTYLGELPIKKLGGFLFKASPLILGIGLLNLIFDHTFVLVIGKIEVSSGVICFLNLYLKAILALWSGLTLMMTTSIEALCWALEQGKVPKAFTTLMLLTYRYVFLLIEEFHNLYSGYKLRAPGQKGVHYKAWGSFLGGLLLRTYRRGERLYESMLLRGYKGSFHSNRAYGFKLSEWVYLGLWSGYLISARQVNFIVSLGNYILDILN